MNADDPRNNCKLKERCECLARNASPHRSSLRMFCEEWQEPEKRIADVHAQSILNWKRLPDQVRVPCLDALRRAVPSHLQQEWREQKARGVAIGSNRVRFHFDEGMAARNVLRKVHPDDFLPLGNWDDYYYGAIDDLASAQPTSVPTVSRVPDGPCEFCRAEPGTMHMDHCPKLREYPAVFKGLGVSSVVVEGDRVVPTHPGFAEVFKRVAEPKITCPSCFGARYVGDSQCPVCMGAGEILDVNYPKQHSYGKRPYHAGRVKMPRYIPPKEFPTEVSGQITDFKTLTDRVVIQTGGVDSCHHHRLTRECPICKRLAAAANVSIPPGVYYNKEHDNFYSFDGTGLGDAFYNSWREHKDRFPIRPSGPIGPLETDCDFA